MKDMKKIKNPYFQTFGFTLFRYIYYLAKSLHLKCSYGFLFFYCWLSFIALIYKIGFDHKFLLVLLAHQLIC